MLDFLRYLLLFIAIGMSIYLNYEIYQANISCASSSVKPGSEILRVIFSVLIFTIPQVIAEIRIYSNKKTLETRLSEIDAYLPLAIKYFRDRFIDLKDTNIRANIMKPFYRFDKFKLHKSLRICRSYNMEIERRIGEHTLFWDISEGACGKAFKKVLDSADIDTWTPAIYWHTINETDFRKHGIPDRNVRITQHVFWVISIPIVCSSKKLFLGVLNIDGLQELPTYSFFESQELNEVCKEWGKIIGYSIDEKNLSIWMRNQFPDYVERVLTSINDFFLKLTDWIRNQKSAFKRTLSFVIGHYQNLSGWMRNKLSIMLRRTLTSKKRNDKNNS